MKFKLLPSIALVLSITASAQTTVKFKPGPTVGEHSTIMTTYGCVFSGSSTPQEANNGYTSPDMHYTDWSYSSLGCGRGTMRELLRFTGLGSIPANAIILNAQLNLFGVSSSLHAPNSTYPGSPYTTTNEGWLKRVTGSWAQNTVTWNSQPATTTTNQVAIEASAAQWNWNTTLNVTDLVKDIMASGQNNGFMFTLQNEQSLRHVEFASSNHSDATLWPELVVTYQLPQSVPGMGSADPLFIYPNPASTNISLQLPVYMNGPATITVADMTGRAIINQKLIVNGNGLNLDVSALAKGLYIVRAENSRGIATAKLTLQ